MSENFDDESEATKLKKAQRAQRAEAKHQAEGERARASQEAAVKKARSVKPKTDADISKSQAKQGLGKAELSGEAEKVSRPAEVKGKVPQKAGSPASAPKAAFKGLEAPPAEAPAKATLAPKAATALKATPTPKIETPEAPTNIGSGKTINATGVVEAPVTPVTPPASDPYASMRASLKAAPVAPSAEPEVSAAMRAANQLGNRAMPEVPGRVGRAGQWMGKATKEGLIKFGKGIISPITEPIQAFRAGSAERAAGRLAANSASASAKTLGERVAARSGQIAMGARTAAATGMLGGRLAIGGAKFVGEGLAAGAVWGLGAAGEEARQHSAVDLHKLVTSGAKQGLKVTTNEPSIWKMAIGGGTGIKVEDPSQAKDSSGTSLSDRRRARGEAKNKAMAFNEEDYQKLKSVASRNVIKGK